MFIQPKGELWRARGGWARDWFWRARGFWWSREFWRAGDGFGWPGDGFWRARDVFERARDGCRRTKSKWLPPPKQISRG